MNLPPFKLAALPGYLAALAKDKPDDRPLHEVLADTTNAGVMDEFKGLPAEDLATIRKIVRRLFDLALEHGVDLDVQTMTMDLMNVHAHTQPINLLALLTANNDDLTHDCLGIHRHIDRKTGRLGGGFRLRHARAPS